MIALIQRVTYARVSVAGQIVGQIGPGLLALVCAQRSDTPAQARALCDKLLKYRVFGDAQGKMNLSVQDVNGGVLLVPQFTLAADTGSGARPSFTPAAPPALAETLFSHFVELTRARHATVETGAFGADMQVTLCNDGPATFWLECQAAA